MATVTDVLSDRIANAGAEIFFAAPVGADPREDNFRRILDELPAAVYVTDALGRITYFNEAAATLWGHRPTIGTSEWCGSWKLFWPDGRALPHGECPMAIAIKEKRSVRGVEAIAERPDGTRVPFEPYPTPLFDASGALIGAVNMLVDLTDRKQAENVKQRLSSIVQFSDDVIISINLKRTIESWNTGAERIFGYAASEVIGQSVEILIPPDRLKEETQILNRIRRGEHIEHYVTVRRRKDGGLIDISLTVSPIRNTLGKVIGASKIARDITERKRNEAHISILAREAEHRAKNILATVQATVHLTQAETIAEFKNAIEGRIQALANVHSLFVESHWTGAELRDLIAKELAPYRKGDGTRLAVEGPSLVLEPSTAQIIAVLFHELATNAVKYGALSVSGGRIGISWGPPEIGRLVLRWTETGGPAVSPTTRKGFGTRVMTSMIHQAKGQIRFDWHSTGLACEIKIPI
jgi:two-component system, chemotaxis family, CheB/CheR fusion protein